VLLARAIASREGSLHERLISRVLSKGYLGERTWREDPMNEAVKQFCTRLGVAHPIIQAPMAGGATTPELVAAVSNAGGLGFIGAAYLTPPALRDAIAAVRGRTDKPFGVNLFAGGYEDAERPVDPAPMLAVVARHHAALGLPEPKPAALTPDPFPAQLETVIESRVPVFSFTFGIPEPADVARLKAQSALVFGTATTVEEARRLAGAGVDGVIAQGSEAGAHRGTFAAPAEMAMIGTLALVPQVVDAVPGLPVIAAGGIMDGRGIVAAEALGAAAVQMGTAFLTSEEAGIPDAYKDFLTRASEDSTKLTRAFSGRPARGVVNAFMRDVEATGAILPYPLQNELTRPMRLAAAKVGDTERLSLWAGQGVGMARRLPAADLVRRLVAEAESARRALAPAY
jgi:nitronate monooxygenase